MPQSDTTPGIGSITQRFIGKYGDYEFLSTDREGVDDDRFYFRLSNPSIVTLNSTTTITLNKWYLVIVTWHKTDGLQLFINGQLEDFSTTGSNWQVSTVDLNLGRDSYNTEHYPFLGLMDEVAIFKRILNETEAQMLWNNGMGRPIDSSWFNTTGLVGLWHFDIEGNDNSTTAYDSSGYGNNGTIEGAWHTDGKIVPNAEANNTIWFALQKNIPGEGYDDNYYLYYDKDDAWEPPSDEMKVFLFYDHFDGTDYDTTKWDIGYADYVVSNSILEYRIATVFD
jgi:hypothetical protein